MSAMSIELSPPRWWRFYVIFFHCVGVFEVLVGAAIVTLWSSAYFGAAPPVISPVGLGAGLLLVAVGVFIFRSARRSRNAKAATLVFAEDHVVIPRVKTGEQLRFSYDEIVGVFWSRWKVTRLRIEIRTRSRSVWIHRAWLAPAWPLERVARELRSRLPAKPAR